MVLGTKERFMQMDRKNMPADEVDHWLGWMLEHIGDVDPELRDEYIYLTFGEWIHQNCLNQDQIRMVLETCLSNTHLFNGIGEREGDAVFTRSFSALVIAEIAKANHSWDREQYKLVLQHSVQFLKEEQDVRGYVDEKGWAHSIAHGADLFVALVEHAQFQIDDADRFLQAVGDAIWKEEVFKDDEEERLSFVIEALVQNGISPRVVERWIHEVFTDLQHLWEAHPFSIPSFRIRTNILHLMKALYFRVDRTDLQKTIKRHLQDWHKRVYHS